MKCQQDKDITDISAGRGLCERLCFQIRVSFQFAFALMRETALCIDRRFFLFSFFFFFSVSDFVLCICTLITTSSLVASRVESTPAWVRLYSKESIKEVVILAALDSRGACPDTLAIRSHLVVTCE